MQYMTPALTDHGIVCDRTLGGSGSSVEAKMNGSVQKADDGSGTSAGGGSTVNETTH
jgi:hypothetical protein